MSDVLLEVVALHAADANAAQEGGADRLQVVGGDGLAPATTTVSSVVRATDLPVRVLLRLEDVPSTSGVQLTRLVSLAESYFAAGAEGVACGFLDRDLEVDVGAMRVVAEAVAPAPVTFAAALDAVLDRGRSWRQVLTLPGVDAVLTAGSSQGVEAGLEQLRSEASDPRVRSLMMVGGDRLLAEHVPWLVHVGIRSFHLGPEVRPGGSWSKAYVDAGFVRSWRLLVDHALARAPEARS
jgi:copper homeostasis protein